MGPTLKGYDKIVRLPTGCGEQNMVNFAPNIYVMKYLNSTDLNVDDISNKAKGFLEKGITLIKNSFFDGYLESK